MRERRRTRTAAPDYAVARRGATPHPGYEGKSLGSFPQNDLLPVWVRFHQSIGLHQWGVRGLRKFGQAAGEIVEIPPQLLEGKAKREDALDIVDRQIAGPALAA